jgi:hydrogenase maturation protease
MTKACDRAQTVVLGLGNPIMGDDGLGLAVLARLRDQWEIEDAELVDGGTWGMNLLPLIEDAGRLLLLDAIRLGSEPGTPHELGREQLPRYLAHKLSPHQIDIKEVLALAELRGNLPAVAVALGAEPAEIDMTTELSRPVEERVDQLAHRAVQLLEQWGHRCRSRMPAVHA